eukprot:gene8055-10074_t
MPSQLVPGKWPKGLETALFHALLKYRPAGVHKHTHMIMVYLQLLRFEPNIKVKDIWSHLETMYDLEELDELESDTWTNAIKEMENGPKKFV